MMEEALSLYRTKHTLSNPKSIDNKDKGYQTGNNALKLYHTNATEIESTHIVNKSGINFKTIGYITVESVNDVKANNINPFFKVGAAIMSVLPPVLTESYALAKSQTKNAVENETKSLTLFAIVGNIFSAAFGIPFWVLLFVVLVLALLEFVLSLVKRFRLPGVDYNPIAKLQIFFGASIFLVATSLVNSTILNMVVGDIPYPLVEKTLSVFNFQTIGMFMAIMFYINLLRKMQEHAMGIPSDSKQTETAQPK